VLRRRLILRDPAVVLGALALVVSGAIVAAMLRDHVAADFPQHVRFTAIGLDTGEFPSNPLFYVLDATLAGFSTDYLYLKGALVVLLAVAGGLKVALSVRFVQDEAAMRRMPLWALGLVGACAVAFSLPMTHSVYLGQVPPNVWHNSTLMLAAPFAVGQFWTGVRYLRAPARRDLLWCLAFGLVGIAAKPSFFLAFGPAFALAVLLRYGWSAPTRDAGLMLAACAVLLAGEYVYTYVVEPAPERGPTDSNVVIDPLRIWRRYSDDLPLSFLASYLFPLAAISLGGRRLRHSRAVRLAVVTAAVGLLEFVLLKETGYREPDANFLWGAIITNYTLFLACVGALVPGLWQIDRSDRAQVARVGLVLAALGAHVVAGLLYLYHLFHAGTFA
jgi:predicted small integral membrane protein